MGDESRLVVKSGRFPEPWITERTRISGTLKCLQSGLPDDGRCTCVDMLKRKRGRTAMQLLA